MHTRSGLPFQMRDNRGGDASRRDNNRRHHQTNSRTITIVYHGIEHGSSYDTLRN
jgi:hypothetical protein